MVSLPYASAFCIECSMLQFSPLSSGPLLFSSEVETVSGLLIIGFPTSMPFLQTGPNYLG